MPSTYLHKQLDVTLTASFVDIHEDPPVTFPRSLRPVWYPLSIERGEH